MLKILKELARQRGSWRSKAWAARQGEQHGKAQKPRTMGPGRERKLCSDGMQGSREDQQVSLGESVGRIT